MSAVPAVPPAAKEKPYRLEPVKGGVLPDPVKLLAASVQDLMDHMGPYVLAALGQLLVMLPLVFVLVFGGLIAVYGVMGAGMVATIVVAESTGGDEAELIMTLGTLATVLLTTGATFALVAVAAGTGAPITASLYRAVAAHQRGEGGLELWSAFSTVTQGAVAAAAVTAIIGLAVGFGAMFCYVPGILLAFVLSFAGPLVYVHGLGPLQALGVSARHVMAHPKWHATYFGLYFVCAMAAAYVPIIGQAFLLAFQVRAYRELFGDGPEPVLDAAAPA